MKYLNPEKFKEKILNLKAIENPDKITDESVKMEAVRLCSIFPELFGDDLDRMTLWDRIGSAIETSIIKANDNIEIFVNSCLEYICAKSSKVATHEELNNWIAVNSVRTDDWKRIFFHYVSTRFFLIIARAREAWEKKKAENKLSKSLPKNSIEEIISRQGDTNGN